MERTAENLTKAHEAYIQKQVESGKKVGNLTAPCGHQIKLLMPSRGETWHSAAQCPYCLAGYFYTISTKGYKVEAMP